MADGAELLNEIEGDVTTNCYEVVGLADRKAL
jgi:hypothetical protein